MPTDKTPVPNLIEALDIQPVSRCGFTRETEHLPQEQRNAISAAVDKIRLSTSSNTNRRTGYSVRWLTETLQQHGIKVSTRMVDRHVSKVCSCDS